MTQVPIVTPGDQSAQTPPAQAQPVQTPVAIVAPTPSLDSIVAQSSTTPTPQANAHQEKTGSVSRIYLLPYERYLTSFSKRFSEDIKFRDNVFGYLKLSRSEKFKLSMGKTFMPGWYGRKMKNIIETYAQQIYGQTKIAYELEQQKLTVAKKFRAASETANQIQTATMAKAQLLESLSATKYEHEREEIQVQENAKSELSAIKTEKAQSLKKIKNDNNVDVFIGEQLMANLKKSEMFVEDSRGNLRFDDDKMASKLEDVLLRKTLSEMQSAGDNSYLSRIDSAWGDYLDRFDTAESDGEIPNADWNSSLMSAFSEGYRRPLLRHMIVPKYEQAQVGEISIETVMAFDYSGSMSNNDRWTAAKQTGGAVRALMRRLTKKSSEKDLFMFHNDRGYEIAPADFQHSNSPGGGTPMHLGLDWLYQRSKLSRDKNLAVAAYLFSDGAPDDVNAAVRSAAKFKDSGILLRLFLVDGDSNTRDIYRQIGTAAGPLTRVASISGYQVASGALKDLEKSISELKSIESF